MKKLIVVLMMLLTVAAMQAVPAHTGVLTMMATDGAVVSVTLVGDEDFHYFVNIADGRKMHRVGNGRLCYYDAETFRREERMAEERKIARQQTRRRCMGKGDAGQRRSITGTKRGLVILAEFQDKKFTYPRTTFFEQFNKEGYGEHGHIGSVHDYFRDQSYGLFDLEFDVIGPVMLDNDMAHYGHHEGQMRDAYPGSMVIEACRKADALGADFSTYDWDGDGNVDQVFVLYAGYGEAYGAEESTVWPHEWTLSNARLTGDGEGPIILDGVKVDTYACSCELAMASGTQLNGIGAVCHEFSHCLGYPDFYDTKEAGCHGMGCWDVMADGCYNGPMGCGEVPCGYTAYERWCAGWLEPTVLREPATVSAMASLGTSPEAYVIYNDENANEYIMLENRDGDKWYRYQKNKSGAYGLLAIHVDYNEMLWTSNMVNTAQNHERMAVIPACGTFGTDMAAYIFGGASGVTALTEDSHGNVGGRWFSECSEGDMLLNHTLSDIAVDADSRKVSFCFDGGEENTTRYTIDYATGDGNCTCPSWTQGYYGEKAVLPAVTPDDEHLTFVGWTREQVEATATMPGDVLKAGTKFRPEGDITLYALYAYVHVPANGNVFVCDDVIEKDADYVLATTTLMGEAYAIDAEALEPRASMTCSGTMVEVTMEESRACIQAPAENAVWTCTYAEGGAVNLRCGSKHMLLGASGMFVTEMNPSLHMLWSTDYGLYCTDGSRGKSYYVKGGQQGSVVVNTTASTTARMYAYKRVGGRPVTYYGNVFGDIDDTTSVPETTVRKDSGRRNGATYNIAGQRVNDGAKGVVIKNGRVILNS